MDNIQDIVRKYGTSMVGTLIGSSVPIHPSATVWFVDSEAANASDVADGDHGSSFELPLATLFTATVGAVAQASAGDVILVAAGHEEALDGDSAVTMAIGASKDGISIIGFSNGAGQNRPLITYANTASVITVGSPNILIKNFEFRASVPEVVAALSLTTLVSDGFTLQDCLFTEDALTTDEFLDAITIATAVTDVTIDNCSYWSQGTPDSFVKVGAVSSRLTVKNCTIYGLFANGILDLNADATVVLLAIYDNILCSAGGAAILVNAASTGIAARNLLGGVTNQAGTFATTSALYCFENYILFAGGQSGVLAPAVETLA